MLVDGFVDRLVLTGKPELWQLWWKVPLASVSFENAVPPCVLRNCLNCGGVVERSWTWRRKARFTYITSSGCQLPFTFFGRQSCCYCCCFELGNLAMPRKQYWTKKILANALHRLGAQYHVHQCFKFRQKNTYPGYVHVLRKTFTLMICRLLIKQLMIMSGLSDSLVRSDIDMSH